MVLKELIYAKIEGIPKYKVNKEISSCLWGYGTLGGRTKSLR